MDLSFISEHYIAIVVIACLIVGYCIKHIKWLAKIANEYIPLIMAVLGGVLACVVQGISVENAVYGALSGLASTGLHQAFKQLIDKGVK